MLKKFRYVLRWLLITIVITGIFFSNGEGIQLLPFPVSPDKNEKSSFLQDEESKSYTISARKFSHSRPIKTKIQKNTKDFSCLGLCANQFDGEKFFISQFEQNHPKTVFIYSSRILHTYSTRGPPLV